MCSPPTHATSTVYFQLRPAVYGSCANRMYIHRVNGAVESFGLCGDDNIGAGGGGADGVEALEQEKTLVRM